MTPAEHFAEAGRLLAQSTDCAVESIKRTMILRAQVHATLATCTPGPTVRVNGYPRYRPVTDAQTTGERI